MGITKKMIIKEKMLGSFIKFSQIIFYFFIKKRMEISPQKLYMDIGA